MFILDQRVSILSTSSIILRRLSIDKDDKIRVNKLEVYHKDQIDLKN